MVDTRRTASGSLVGDGSGQGDGGNGNGGNGNGGNGGNGANPRTKLPPPPPNPLTAEQLFQQFLGSQRNMEATLRDIAANTSHGGHRDRPVNQYSTFKDFLDTDPPKFLQAKEPLEALEWINTMEDKFRLLRLTESLKVEYGAHQLQGPAGIWWSHQRTTFPPNAPITWRSSPRYSATPMSHQV